MSHQENYSEVTLHTGNYFKEKKRQQRVLRMWSKDCCRECKVVQILRKTIWEFLVKLSIINYHLTRHFASTCLPKKCPSGSDWVNKLRCIYTVEPYSANTMEQTTNTCHKQMNLKIMLSERSQTKEYLWYDFIYMKFYKTQTNL